MPSIALSVDELRTSSSVISICPAGPFQSVLTLFNAILTYGRDITSAALNLGQALFKAAAGIAGSVAELIWANLFVIALCVGGYYLYTKYMQKSPKRGKGS